LLTHIGCIVVIPIPSLTARRRPLDHFIELAHSINALAGHFQRRRPAVSPQLRVVFDAGLGTKRDE
jgi:hypothetical protein